MAINIKKYNVFMLGLSFCLVLTAFNTMGGIQTLIFNSKADFDGNGYTRYSYNFITRACIVYTSRERGSKAIFSLPPRKLILGEGLMDY